MFTGLFYRDQIAEYYKANGLPEPYEDTRDGRSCPRRWNGASWPPSTARTPLVPQDLVRRQLRSRPAGLQRSLWHRGELCDICPLSQLDRCAERPQGSLIRAAPGDRRALARRSWPGGRGHHRARGCRVRAGDRAASVLPATRARFQVHDVRHPHHARRHGRAGIGWKDSTQGG